MLDAHLACLVVMYRATNPSVGVRQAAFGIVTPASQARMFVQKLTTLEDQAGEQGGR
jgi:hypothetical protein